jgi:hypothetical protein
MEHGRGDRDIKTAMPSFKNIINLIGSGQTIWNGLLFLFPGLGAVVTGILAHGENVPWSFIIFLACGVLCFLSVSIHYASNWWRDNSVKGKVRLEQLQVVQVGKQRSSDDMFTLNCKFIVTNHSMFDLYFRLDDALLILQGKSGDKNISKQIIILPTGVASNILFRSVTYT